MYLALARVVRRIVEKAVPNESREPGTREAHDGGGGGGGHGDGRTVGNK